MNVTFLILSYNRPEETIEAVDNIIHFIDHPSDVKIEIIIINNNSSVSYEGLDAHLKKLGSDDDIVIRYIVNKSNLGVAGGRNQGMKLATGDIIFSLDDDAEWREKDIISRSMDLFKKTAKDNVGLLTFKVVEQSDNSIDLATKDKSKYNDREFYATFFKGGAHVIKKSVFEKVGGYEMSTIYGAEEYDLSYKLLDLGYRIYHSSDISILHKRSLTGRSTSIMHYKYLMKNKTLLAYKYLPLKYFYSHLVLWSGFFLKNTSFNLKELFNCIVDTMSSRKTLKRSPLKASTIDYIKSINGRLTH